MALVNQDRSGTTSGWNLVPSILPGNRDLNSEGAKFLAVFIFFESFQNISSGYVYIGSHLNGSTRIPRHFRGRARTSPGGLDDHSRSADEPFSNKLLLNR